MDIEYLIYFNKIAETGNISQAARKLSLSQPALSLFSKTLKLHWEHHFLTEMDGQFH